MFSTSSPPNRIQPQGKPSDYKTFSINAPIQTHTRVVPCTPDNCPDHANGWVTVLEVSKRERARLATWIRHNSGRRFYESTVAYSVDPATGEQTETPLADGWVAFYFPAGQQCFTEHREKLDRQELYIARAGDWRKTVGPVKRYDAPHQWADDLHTHTEHIREVRSRG